MAKKLEYEIGVDASKGVSGLKQFAGAAKKELGAVSDELDDTSSNAEKVARVLAESASKMETELRGAATAAGALGQALGPDIAARADLDQIVADLNRMGLSFDEITADADKLAAALRELDRVGNLDLKADIRSDITGTAEAELDDLERSVGRVDGEDVVIHTDADEQAGAELRDLQRQAEQVDGEEVTIKARGEGLDGLTNQLGALPGMLGQAASAFSGGGGLVAGAGAAAAAIGLAANNYAQLAVNAKVTADLTGATAEEASRLQAVWRMTGADANDLNDVLLQMNGVLQTSPELAQQLGINMNDGKNIVERLYEVIQKVDASTGTAAEKAQIMSQAFGEEGVRQTQKLLSLVGGPGGLVQALEDVSEAQIMDDEDVEQALAFERAMQEAKLQVEGLANTLGSQVVPALAQAIGLGGDLVGALNQLQQGDIPGIEEPGWVSEGIQWINPVTRGFKFLELGMDALNGSGEELTGTFVDTETSAEKFAKELAAIAAASKTFVLANKPMSDMPRTWRTAEAAVKRMRQGLEPTADQLQAVLVLTQQYGIEAPEVYARAAAAIDEHTGSLRGWAGIVPDAIQKAKDFAAAQLEIGDAAREVADDFVDAQDSLNEMATSFHEMERREGALESAFDLGDAPLDALEKTQDVFVATHDLIDLLNEKRIHIEGSPIDAINDWVAQGGDPNTAPLLAKIDTLRDTVQTRISDAFATGGAPAARAMALSLIEQIRNSFGGYFTSQQIAELIGLDDFEAIIKIALEQESLDEARAQLQLLAGLPGADPLYVAQIQLALDAGTLSPQAASVLLAEKLGDFGLDVPTELLPADPADLAAARAEADAFIAANPLIFNSDVATPDPEEAHRQAQVIAEALKIAFPTLVEKPTNVNTVVSDTQKRLNALPPVKIRGELFIPARGAFDSGGTAGTGGGIAGERGPEILNGKYLTTGPTYVPPGTKVTSRRQTAVILRNGGTSGLRRYDQGGIVAGPSTLNINVTAGVVGNRYDVMRAVERAGRDKIRLLGTRV